MNELSAGTLEAIYLGVIGVVTALLMWSGWRQGLARQLMTLLAIVGAYLVGWYGGSAVAPLFEFLRYPEPVTRIIGSVAAGLATFIAIRALRVLLFKKTAQYQSSAVRFSYGLLGALMGLVFGGVLLFVSSDAIRLLGTIANAQVRAAEQQKKTLEADPARAKKNAGEEPNSFIQGLAKLSNALDQGSTGQFLKHYDPVPKNVYVTIAKLAIMVSNQDSLTRFLAYPGVERLANHPKLVALRNDPGVGELLANSSYLKLLRHEKVVALASDPEFAAEIKRVDFDEALNSALKNTQGAEL